MAYVSYEYTHGRSWDQEAQHRRGGHPNEPHLAYIRVYAVDPGLIKTRRNTGISKSANARVLRDPAFEVAASERRLVRWGFSSTSKFVLKHPSLAALYI